MNSNKNQKGQAVAVYALIILVVVGVLVGLRSMRIVDVAKSCTWVRLGNVVGEAKPGFQFTNPLNTKVCYPRQSVLFQTAGDVTGNGKVDSSADFYDFPVEIKTFDGQSATVEFNLTFHVEPGCAGVIRAEFANDIDDLVTRVVNNFSRSLPRDIAPLYNATELYGQQRVDYEYDIRYGVPEWVNDKGEVVPPIIGLEERFDEKCVVLDEFLLRDINFDPAYESIMESKQVAMEGITVQKFIADQAVQDARATVTKAQKSADAQIEKARGDAETTRLMAIAEADAMRVKGQALKDFPEMIQLKFFDALSTAEWSLIPWDSVGGYMPLPTTP